jgi:hypothetical protein
MKRLLVCLTLSWILSGAVVGAAPPEAVVEPQVEVPGLMAVPTAVAPVAPARAAVGPRSCAQEVSVAFKPIQRSSGAECLGPCFGSGICPERPWCTNLGCFDNCCWYECW